jgi:hypothetical protein
MTKWSGSNGKWTTPRSRSQVDEPIQGKEPRVRFGLRGFGYERSKCARLRVVESKGVEGLMRKLLIALTILTVVSIVAGPASGAGKGGGKGHGGSGATGGGSLNLVLLNSTDGQAHYGQQVTFNVVANDSDWPQVNLNCYKDGVWVYAASAGFFSSYPWSRNFTLATTNTWTSGEADCTGTLYLTPGGGKSKAVDTVSFHVYP